MRITGVHVSDKEGGDLCGLCEGCGRGSLN